MTPVVRNADVHLAGAIAALAVGDGDGDPVDATVTVAAALGAYLDLVLGAVVQPGGVWAVLPSPVSFNASSWVTPVMVIVVTVFSHTGSCPGGVAEPEGAEKTHGVDSTEAVCPGWILAAVRQENRLGWPSSAIRLVTCCRLARWCSWR